MTSNDAKLRSHALCMMGSYEDRKVSKTVLDNGLKVSTADTTDMEYETAVIDANQVRPVERYETREQAVEGHAKWCKHFEKSPKTALRLGYGDDIQDEEFDLDYGGL